MATTKHNRRLQDTFDCRKNKERHKQWCEEYIRKLESHITPPEENPAVVKEVVPPKLYAKISPLLGLEGTRIIAGTVSDYVDIDDDGEDKETEEEEEEDKIKHTVPRPTVQFQTQKPCLSSELQIQPPTSTPRIKDMRAVEVPPDNAYINFLNRREPEAAIWRPKEELNTEEGLDRSVLLNPSLDLSMKAEILTNKIAEDFCKWLRQIGGKEEVKIDEEVLAELFEIGFNMPAARSLCVLVREMPVVTSAVATAAKIPEAELRQRLRRELLRDIEAENRESHLIAFGTAIPWDSSQRFKPPENKVYENWLQCKRVPKDLETMSQVWEGITHLRSVQMYCNWLKKRKSIPIPPYLQKHGLGETSKNKSQYPRNSFDVELSTDDKLPSKMGEKSSATQQYIQRKRRSSPGMRI